MRNDFLINQKTAAALCRLSVRAFQKWDLRPDHRDGREVLYDARRVLDFARDREQRPQHLDLTAERARLAAAQAEKTELDVAEREGRVIPVEAMVIAWSDVLTAFRARMLRVREDVSRLAVSEATPMAIAQATRAGINEALNELAQFDPVGEPGPPRDQK